MNSNIQTLTARNQSLADYNLRKKPDLEARINSLKQCQEKYKILRDEFSQKMQSLGIVISKEISNFVNIFFLIFT